MTLKISAPEIESDAAEPLDPDFVFLTDYLVHDLSPEGVEEFERRFSEDEAFYEKVAPVIGEWHKGVDWMALVKAEIANDAARAQHLSLAKAPPARKLRLTPTRTLSSIVTLALAASIIVTILRPNRSGPVDHPIAFVPPEPPRAAVVLGPPISAMVAPEPRPLVSRILSSPLAVSAAQVPMPDLMGVAPVVLRAVLHMPTRAELRRLLLGRTVASLAGQTRLFVLDDSTALFMRGDTRIRYVQPIPNLGYGAQAYPNGDFVIGVSAQERYLRLISDAGQLQLTPGLYAVRCEDDGSFYVTVVLGHAALTDEKEMGATTGVQSVGLNPGQFGRLLAGGKPELVTDGSRFPTFRDSL